MQTHGITYEQVAKTAENLLQQGLQPTTKAVRTELGSGSQSTITKHLRQWRDQQSALSLTDIESSIPKELLIAISLELKKVAADTKKALETKLESTEKALDEATDLLEKEEYTNKKLHEELKKFEFENEKLRSKILEIEQQNKSLKNATDETNRKRQQEREDYSSLKSAFDYLEKDLERQISFLKTEREARLAAEIELAKLQGKHQK